MSTRIREHIRRNLWGIAAVFIALGGTAHATHPGGADTISTEDIINGQVRSVDIGNAQVVAADVRDDTLAGGGLTAADLAPDSVASSEVTDDGMLAADLAANSVGASEIQTDGVQATEVANNSIDSGEIVDFGLSNQDVGVLYASVNANGTLEHSSGGVTSSNLGSNSGLYVVDFGRNITTCAFVATVAQQSVGDPVIPPGETHVTDRSGNVEAVFVSTFSAGGASQDKPFHLVVVC